MIGQISLEGIEFFAYHGFYSEERKIGNKFGIDLTITANLADSPHTDDLSQTIDYEAVYKIIKKEIEVPTKLLENVANRIILRLLEEFEEISIIKISVSKFNPPVGGICHRAKVTLEKYRQS